MLLTAALVRAASVFPRSWAGPSTQPKSKNVTSDIILGSAVFHLVTDPEEVDVNKDKHEM